MDKLQQDLLYEIAGIKDFPNGAYNIRVDGKSAGRASTKNISVAPLSSGKQGLEIHIQPGTKETVYIPVLISESGYTETVYNDFYIGEDSDVEIIAGCGIHSCEGEHGAQHDGIHSFFIGKNAKVTYIEKHYGEGAKTSKRVFNPVTKVFLDEGASMNIETTQIKGVSSTKRVTQGKLKDSCSLIVKEKLMTDGDDYAETEFDVNLDGENSKTNVVSRSVARGNSTQIFVSKINGNNKCSGHSECDAIIMDNSCVKAVPEITANHIDAALIHEAAIGKIAGEQIIKLMTLGLTEAEAEEQIVNGFLK